jgi:Reverse transcriptase (RNA-dependent DNA polymerase)
MDDDSNSDSESSSSSSSNSDSDDDDDHGDVPEIQILDNNDVNVPLRNPRRNRAPAQAAIAPLAPINQPPAIVQPPANLGVEADEEEANPGVDVGENRGVEVVSEADEDADGSGAEDDALNEYDQFRAAEEVGRMQAQQQVNERPRRTAHPKRDDDFVYAMVHTLLESIRNDNAFVTAQMSAKAGLKRFGQRGSDAVVKELKQLLVMKVMNGCLPRTLSTAQKSKALKYLMFLKEKRSGTVKGRGCADGRKQRLYKTKAETSSPTVSIESLVLSCLIDALEKRDVATCDIPGAFMQADVDEEIHIKFDGKLVDLLISVDQSYAQYVVYEKGKRVIYAVLNKALYGTVQASLLFWKRLIEFLVQKHGFKRNPYDFCVVNKTIDGKQCTIVWYVDDLKISHVNSKIVDGIIDVIKDEFGNEMPVPVTRGKIHDYLGIKIDFSQEGKVIMSMFDYIDELLKECPEDLMKGISSSGAAGHLYVVNDKAEKLDGEMAILFHHFTAKLLYLSKRTRPDLQTPVSFLTTRVKCPDVDDWKKLGRCLRFLRDTKNDPHTLEADGSGVIRWWVDASFAVHPDMKSHTGAAMSMGKGCAYAISRRQRLNTTSSTEAELVGVSDVMGLILWTRRFLQAQGYTVSDNVVYQDNQSAMLLQNNGRMSSSKRTRHIDIRYFFVTDNIQNKNMRVEYCPTDDMLADFFTKPLQGSKYRRFRSMVLNLNTGVDVARKECVETSDSGITNSVSPTNTTPTLPESSDDDGVSQSSTPWIEVDRRRKNSNSKQVKGKQSERKAHSVYLTQVVN